MEILTTEAKGKPSATDFAELERNAGRASELLGSMANPRRLLVLCKLVEGEMSVNALADAVGLSQSALSQHLAKLRQKELVSTRRDGQTIYYRLAGEEVRAVLSTLYGLYCGR